MLFFASISNFPQDELRVWGMYVVRTPATVLVPGCGLIASYMMFRRAFFRYLYVLYFIKFLSIISTKIRKIFRQFFASPIDDPFFKGKWHRWQKIQNVDFFATYSGAITIEFQSKHYNFKQLTCAQEEKKRSGIVNSILQGITFSLVFLTNLLMDMLKKKVLFSSQSGIRLACPRPSRRENLRLDYD